MAGMALKEVNYGKRDIINLQLNFLNKRKND